MPVAAPVTSVVTVRDLNKLELEISARLKLSRSLGSASWSVRLVERVGSRKVPWAHCLVDIENYSFVDADCPPALLAPEELLDAHHELRFHSFQVPEAAPAGLAAALVRQVVATLGVSAKAIRVEPAAELFWEDWFSLGLIDVSEPGGEPVLVGEPITVATVDPLLLRDAARAPVSDSGWSWSSMRCFLCLRRSGKSYDEAYLEALLSVDDDHVAQSALLALRQESARWLADLWSATGKCAAAGVALTSRDVVSFGVSQLVRSQLAIVAASIGPSYLDQLTNHLVLRMGGDFAAWAATANPTAASADPSFDARVLAELRAALGLVTTPIGDLGRDMSDSAGGSAAVCLAALEAMLAARWKECLCSDR